MKRVIKGETGYDEGLKQELENGERACQYANCPDKATELFYVGYCDLHFYFCEEHTNFIEKGGWKEGTLTIDIETRKRTFKVKEQ